MELKYSRQAVAKLCVESESQLGAVAKLHTRNILTTANLMIGVEENSGKQRGSEGLILTNHPVNFALVEM